MIIEKKKYGFLDMVLIPFKVSPMYSIIFAIKYIADALMPTLSIFATASFINNAIMVYNIDIKSKIGRKTCKNDQL